MRHAWRIGLALVVVGTFLGRGTTASAQGAGAAATAPGGAVGADREQDASVGGGLLQPGPGDARQDESTVRTVPPPPRTGRFGRVTSTQRQVITTAPPGASARSGGGAGAMGQNGQTRANAGQAARNSGTPRDRRVPVGSSWQDTRRPANPPSVTTKSTTHNYYPTMRRAAGPNANVPMTQRGGRAGVGGGVAGGMMMNGMMGGAQGPAGRSAQSAPSGHGPAPGRR